MISILVTVIDIKIAKTGTRFLAFSKTFINIITCFVIIIVLNLA